MPFEEPAFSVIVHPEGLVGPWQRQAMALVSAATAVDGEPPIEEGAVSALDGPSGGKGRAPAVTVHPVKGGRPPLAGFALVDHGRASFAIDPYYREPSHLAAVALAEAVVPLLAESEEAAASPTVTLVVNETRPEHRAFAAKAGLDRERRLYQMRCALPLPEELRAEGRRIRTRPFRPGVDDEAWLEVNNAAFAGHPDQGGWTSEDLRRETRHSWFDPADLLLAELAGPSGRERGGGPSGRERGDGELAGFCWTKVHQGFGEIYVIAVSPALSAKGLGRQLVCAGLNHMTAKVAPEPLTGMLYTEADNIPAVKLYVALGFEVHHVHRVFYGPQE